MKGKRRGVLVNRSGNSDNDPRYATDDAVARAPIVSVPSTYRCRRHRNDLLIKLPINRVLVDRSDISDTRYRYVASACCLRIVPVPSIHRHRTPTKVSTKSLYYILRFTVARQKAKTHDPGAANQNAGARHVTTYRRNALPPATCFPPSHC